MTCPGEEVLFICAFDTTNVIWSARHLPQNILVDSVVTVGDPILFDNAVVTLLSRDYFTTSLLIRSNDSLLETNVTCSAPVDGSSSTLLYRRAKGTLF